MNNAAGTWIPVAADEKPNEFESVIGWIGGVDQWADVSYIVYGDGDPDNGWIYSTNGGRAEITHWARVVGPSGVQITDTRQARDMQPRSCYFCRHYVERDDLCSRITETASDSTPSAHIRGGVEGDPVLHVSADFGCVLWEERKT